MRGKPRLRNRPRCVRCAAINMNGEQCKRASSCRVRCMGLCFQHSCFYQGRGLGCRVAYKQTSASTIGDGLAVRRSTIARAGNGLFATKKFCKGDIITRYDGTVISVEEARRIERAGRHSHLRSLVPMRSVIDGLKTYPARRGVGGASYANDGMSADINNSKFVKLEVSRANPETHIYLKATKTIERGSEVFVAYGRDYWRRFGV